ncbi:hypothetical protein C2G38_2233748 [Gigaspora rosea]|uniref:Uncharacterized protein n=1 Tax=Gigaspora rosea TaxID=44941 RepID=A0A397TW50_9GLOM|nr:hypothetical protein C2G38_2233748 [Gigaspora rosea]
MANNLQKGPAKKDKLAIEPTKKKRQAEDPQKREEEMNTKQLAERTCKLAKESTKKQRAELVRKFTEM